MSSLYWHAEAARHLGLAFNAEADRVQELNPNTPHLLLLRSMAIAHLGASFSMANEAGANLKTERTEDDG